MTMLVMIVMSAGLSMTDDDDDDVDDDDNDNGEDDDKDDDDVDDIEVGHLVRFIKTWRQRWPAAKLRHRWGEARFHFVLLISQVVTSSYNIY